ncbi:MAG: hypothetical protein D3923_18610, partial [Candidatus Electrothrix sp. AR3]|nr:hypothetical protein [Candidatus Electrothrix sp. AR3]
TPPEVTTPPFADVPADEWYAKYITYAKERNWVQGCDPANNLFCPGDPVNRVEAAKIISLGLQPGLLEEMKNNRQPEWLFSDVQDTGKWYYPYVYTLQTAHAVHGSPYDTLYSPADPTKREELAKMVCVAGFGETDCTDMDRPDAQ